MNVEKFPGKPKSEKPSLSAVHDALERAHSLVFLLETAYPRLDKTNQNAIGRVIQTIKLEIGDAAALIEMIQEQEEIALHGDVKPK